MTARFRADGPEAKFGDLGEELARSWLMREGYAVLPVSLIENGGAPVFESDARRLISPDILACRNGSSVLVDVKSKARRAFNRKFDRWQTGCSLRHYHSYMACGAATGMRAALCFIHADDPNYYLGFLDELVVGESRSDDAQVHEPSGMIYFNIDEDRGTKFRIYPVEQDGRWRAFRDAAMPSKIIRPWEVARL